MSYITGFVHPDLMREIDRKRNLFSDSGSKDSLSSQLLSVAFEDATYHSLILEADKAKNSERVGRKRDFSSVRSGLRESWVLAEKAYSGTITSSIICQLASKIEPKSAGAYRDRPVYVNYRTPYVPPPASKVPHEMELMLRVTNNPDISFLERALHLHFHFLRIHPFVDGNGRTSRFFQNFLLSKGGYPPAMTPVGDRSIYNALIRSAQEGFKYRGADEGLSIAERISTPPPFDSPEGYFYEFLASKVNVSLDSVIDRLEDLPNFRIDLYGTKDPHRVHSIKVHLQGYFSRLGSPGQVRLVDQSRGVIEVRGEIPEGVIQKIVSKTHDRGFKISRNC